MIRAIEIETPSSACALACSRRRQRSDWARGPWLHASTKTDHTGGDQAVGERLLRQSDSSFGIGATGSQPQAR